MATTINKYRVWCNTDNKWEETWDEFTPTICPINYSHDINHETVTIIDSVTQEFPTTDLDNYQLAVHNTSKPTIPGITTFAVWTGSGDLLSDDTDVGGGDLLQFNLQPGTPSKTVRVQFNPVNGRVWIHQAYLRFQGGGIGDTVRGDVVALATPLQQSVNLNLEIINDWIVPSANGTHGFADPTKIALLPRTFSKDGNWDWDGYNLTPNLNGNGAYKISYIDRTIHRFVNNVSCRGICETWSPLQSNETTELPSRYVLDIIATNASNSTWGVDVLIEVYREKTHNP